MTVPLVVGTGLVALDVVIRGKGATPVRRCVGGTCGNVLTILRYLGWKSVPLARLESDRARAIVEADLARWHVDTRFIDIEPVAPTPVVVQRLLRDANDNPIHRFSWTCPCCGAWFPKYTPVGVRSTVAVLEELSSPAVFFFDRPSRGAVALAAAYSKQGALIMFEPSASGEPELFQAALEIADVIKYSNERFETLPPHKPQSRQRLEVQTLGAEGLRYRMGKGRRPGKWRRLSSITIGTVVDTAGAGDWCTAGLLSHVGRNGREGFEQLSDNEFSASLRYGQALAAWNCRFEGARGGMYERTRLEFEREVAALIAGDTNALPSLLDDTSSESLEDICPACPGRKTMDVKGMRRPAEADRKSGV